MALAGIEVLQKAMSQLPQAGLDTYHYFADGMYARVVERKKGVLIIGKVHKKEHFYIVSRGTVAVSDGENPAETYPCGSIIVSKPGTKRAVLALEDSICLTIHRTDKLDLDEIEEEIVEPDHTALFDASNKLKQEVLT